MHAPPSRLLPPTLERNLRAVRDRIERAALAAERAPEEVQLLPVTKTVAPEIALELAALGCGSLAENRLDSLEAKRAAFERAGVAVEWHFIGPIQRNKARRILRGAAVLHSVDSRKLLRTLERIAAEEGLRPRIYLEVKLAPEAEKHGLEADELAACVRLAGEAEHLELVGLMTMAPRPGSRASSTEESGARACFEELRRLARELEGQPELARAFRGGEVRLSMGMSGDFETAIAAGSHVCRVGSALYDERGNAS